jgi:hypothetical protein
VALVLAVFMTSSTTTRRVDHARQREVAAAIPAHLWSLEIAAAEQQQRVLNVRALGRAIPVRLTAKPRPEPPATRTLQPGQSVSTSEEQRDRVKLADGTQVLLNATTTLVWTSEDTLQLIQGSVFLDRTSAATMATGSPSAGTTRPRLQVAGRILHLDDARAVLVQAEDTASVTSLQGSVQVDGFDEPVVSGTQVRWAISDDQASALSSVGRLNEARRLLEQVTGGSWQPRFAATIEQAKQELAGL